MRVVKLKETEIECPNCKATLAFTSEDIKISMLAKYVKCPICHELIVLEQYF